MTCLSPARPPPPYPPNTWFICLCFYSGRRQSKATNSSLPPRCRIYVLSPLSTHLGNPALPSLLSQLDMLALAARTSSAPTLPRGQRAHWHYDFCIEVDTVKIPDVRHARLYCAKTVTFAMCAAPVVIGKALARVERTSPLLFP